MKVICHKCGQDHNQMLSKWCDLSILEIKYHRLEQELAKKEKLILELEDKVRRKYYSGMPKEVKKEFDRLKEIEAMYEGLCK